MLSQARSKYALALPFSGEVKTDVSFVVLVSAVACHV